MRVLLEIDYKGVGVDSAEADDILEGNYSFLMLKEMAEHLGATQVTVVDAFDEDKEVD